jgi:hypothetical protein
MVTPGIAGAEAGLAAPVVPGAGRAGGGAGSGGGEATGSGTGSPGRATGWTVAWPTGALLLGFCSGLDSSGGSSSSTRDGAVTCARAAPATSNASSRVFLYGANPTSFGC